MSAQTADDAYTCSLVTSDKPGVLSRISLIFARRGFNIESLAVSPGAAKGFARMTITSRGDPDAREQIIKQLAKLVDVVYVSDHRDDDALEVEIAFIKVRCSASQHDEAIAVAREHGAALSDDSEGRLVFTAHGESGKLDALVDALGPFNLEEIVRSGKIVIDRGASHFAHLLGHANAPR